MDKRLLESFVSVYRSGSLVESAKRLNVSQSALSRRLTELQSRLGVVLFKASGRGIVRTSEAERLVPLAVGALEGILALEAAARLGGGPAPVHLTVATTAQMIEGIVAEQAVAFMRLHPNFSIRLIEAGGAEVEELVLSGKALLGLTARPRFQAGLVDRQLMRLNVLAVGAEPFTTSETRNGIDLKVLCRRKLMVLDRRYQSRLILDAALRLAQLSPTIVHEGNSTSAIVALVRAGMGTGVVPSSARTDLPTARITANGVPLAMDLTAIWDPTAAWRSEVEQFAMSLAPIVPGLRSSRGRGRKRARALRLLGASAR